MATPPPKSAAKHYGLSALMARRAASEARKALGRGLRAAHLTVVTYQAAQAVMSQNATAEMLAEQSIDEAAEAFLNSVAFTTSLDTFEAMVTAAADVDYERLVASLVQDAGRAAESVSVAVRRDVYHVRYVSPPCCARCAVLAGRVYRWSDGFQRHPGCDCSMIPTTVAAPYAQDPQALFEAGQIKGLSQADARAIRDGADIGRVVNVRARSAGLLQSGRVLVRAGRLTPEGCYAKAGGDRTRALELLASAGYIL